MEGFFAEVARQFGLPVGLLLVAVITIWHYYQKKDQEGRAHLLKELEEVKIERNYYRDRWHEEVDKGEVWEEATKRIAGGGRRRPGGR